MKITEKLLQLLEKRGIIRIQQKERRVGTNPTLLKLMEEKMSRKRKE